MLIYNYVIMYIYVYNCMHTFYDVHCTLQFYIVCLLSPWTQMGY